MKIAIPTNNLISIADDITKTSKIKVFHIEKNCITNEEIIDNNLKNDYKELPVFYKNIQVTLIILNKINTQLEDELNKNSINVVCSKELLITNAITTYLKDSNLKESNFCCCP